MFNKQNEPFIYFCPLKMCQVILLTTDYTLYDCVCDK